MVSVKGQTQTTYFHFPDQIKKLQNKPLYPEGLPTTVPTSFCRDTEVANLMECTWNFLWCWIELVVYIVEVGVQRSTVYTDLHLHTAAVYKCFTCILICLQVLVWVRENARECVKLVSYFEWCIVVVVKHFHLFLFIYKFWLFKHKLSFSSKTKVLVVLFSLQQVSSTLELWTMWKFKFCQTVQ